MLEELAMEMKNSVRSGQGPSKGNCAESKKSQDATVTKQFTRNGRKRETSNSNGAKYDQNRKPLPQKSKTIDKRPKPRGLFNGSRKENSQIRDEEYEAEFGSIFAIGSKKQSLNHLLNFHYEPRGENMPKRPQQSPNGFSTKSLMATTAHKYNKEQFLQANCQFVVKKDGDYSFNMVDPDLLVDWDHVELIVTSSSEKVVCPICLYPPVAGKITRCGHIYCWSCVLHYLALSDKTWRKCPICYEAIHKNDLKSVECIETAHYSVGQNITMRLMKREKGTLVATPVSQFSARTSKPILSYGETEVDTVYSKLLTASHDIVSDLIKREYSELQSKVEEFKGCPEMCFVDHALELLAQRRSLLEYSKNVEASPKNNGLEDTPKENTTPCKVSATIGAYSNYRNGDIMPKESCVNSKPGEAASLEPYIFQQNGERCESDSGGDSGGSEGDDVLNVQFETLEINTPNRTHKYFYFYQAADGQQIYLHSINVKMLEMTYGSLENSPLEINGRIIEKESGSMTPQLRNRLRYLQHVPITCQFEVTELDIRPPTISDETYKHFQDQIDDRRKRRQRVARAEKKREKKIEEAEMRHFNRQPTPNLRIESLYHFPECGMDDIPRQSETQSVVSDYSSRSGSPLVDDIEGSSSSNAAHSLDTEDTSPSFAQMLRAGKPIANELWPTVGSSELVKSSTVNNGAWPRRQHLASMSQELTEYDNDTAFSPPARHSFNIAEAIQLAASIDKGETSCGHNGKKKKRKQKLLLFSTGVPKGN